MAGGKAQPANLAFISKISHTGQRSQLMSGVYGGIGGNGGMVRYHILCNIIIISLDSIYQLL
jgi:hypothetical protein